jgi:hypothetical protein
LPVVPWAENRWLSIEQITETGKIESAGNICRVTREGGRSMATKLIAKGSGGEKPAAKKSPAKKGGSARKVAANGPATSAKATPAPKAKKRLPAATIRAMKELAAGKLNRYADADDMFQKLGIKLGKEDKA